MRLLMGDVNRSSPVDETPMCVTRANWYSLEVYGAACTCALLPRTPHVI